MRRLIFATALVGGLWPSSAATDTYPRQPGIDHRANSVDGEGRLGNICGNNDPTPPGDRSKCCILLIGAKSPVQRQYGRVDVAVEFGNRAFDLANTRKKDQDVARLV